jgi:hypothetical protein
LDFGPKMADSGICPGGVTEIPATLTPPAT